MTKDFKETLNLPATDFQMKANLPQKEPEILNLWRDEGLYSRIRALNKGHKKYVLHDGPPYANGHIHLGHALNKILKDIIVKNRSMSGFDAYFVPGWDCHGLPIELQVERSLGKEGETLPKPAIRKLCREYAKKFVSIQREEFKRLGVFGEWDTPYLTMDYSYQASILRELARCVRGGFVYMGKKPVHWCYSCKTALAEAEVEYADKESPSIYVRFRMDAAVRDRKLPEFKGKDVSIMIWTTTPWTIPANLAVALNPSITYVAVETEASDIFIVAEGLLGEIAQVVGWQRYNIIRTIKPDDLFGVSVRHPFLDRESLIVPGDHVTLDSGTGCVHIAPGHGQEDYDVGLRHGLEIYAPVDNKGRFTVDAGEFKGQFVFGANNGVINRIKSMNNLVCRQTIRHSYPHCWRCKNPVIFRATRQWFISVDNDDLRKRALDCIDKVTWVPMKGRERILNMVLNRPDWCISRQRVWGVPIVAYKCNDCEEGFISDELITRTADKFETHGADIWFEWDIDKFLPDGLTCSHCGSTSLSREEDILDVWFDSGSSFAAVLERDDRLTVPADIYLEGNDQHRGWFQASLLISVATRGEAPFRTVLTHGFVVDGNGRKMSKSTGNVIAPQEIISKYGTEILRLWVASEDYRDDIKISGEILKRLSEAYRRIRNTCRYILGNISDFDPLKDAVSYQQLGDIDRFALHNLSLLREKVLKAYDEFEFHTIYHSVHNFCAMFLSSFYLDSLKDRLYCSSADSQERRAAQTTIYYILDYLVRLMAPILPFTMDEVWRSIPSKEENRLPSVHLSSMPEKFMEWIDGDLEKRWDNMLSLKVEVSKALEHARRNKIIGHPLDAMVTINFQDSVAELSEDECSSLKEALIISGLAIKDLPSNNDVGGREVVLFKSEEIKGFTVLVEKASGKKCQRCWNFSATVGSDYNHPTICTRCRDVLAGMT